MPETLSLSIASPAASTRPLSLQIMNARVAVRDNAIAAYFPIPELAPVIKQTLTETQLDWDVLGVVNHHAAAVTRRRTTPFFSLGADLCED